MGGAAGRTFDSQFGAPAGIRIQKNLVASAQTNFACFRSIVCTDFSMFSVLFFIQSKKAQKQIKKHKTKNYQEGKKQKTKNALKKTSHTPQYRQNCFFALGFFLRKTKEEKKSRTIITKLMNSVKTKHCMAASFRQIHTLAHIHAQLASQHYLFCTEIFTAGFQQLLFCRIAFHLDIRRQIESLLKHSSKLC